MSKAFIGNVSISVNTKGEIVLKKNESGKYNAKKAPELLARIEEVAVKEKLAINSYTIFAPEGREGKSPILLANKWGAPYLAFLSPQQANGKAKARILD